MAKQEWPVHASQPRLHCNMMGHLQEDKETEMGTWEGVVRGGAVRVGRLDDTPRGKGQYSRRKRMQVSMC